MELKIEHHTLQWTRPEGILVRVSAPARVRPWRLHAGLVAFAGAFAAAIAAFDATGDGRGALVDPTGVLVAAAWVAYAAVATVLVAWRGRRGGVLALHGVALLLAPVLAAAGLAALRLLGRG